MKLHWFDYDLRQIIFLVEQIGYLKYLTSRGKPKLQSEITDQMIDLERKSAYLHHDGVIALGQFPVSISRPRPATGVDHIFTVCRISSSIPLPQKYQRDCPRVSAFPTSHAPHKTTDCYYFQESAEEAGLESRKKTPN